MMLMLG
jgi:hypothetical protein